MEAWIRNVWYRSLFLFNMNYYIQSMEYNIFFCAYALRIYKCKRASTNCSEIFLSFFPCSYVIDIEKAKMKYFYYFLPLRLYKRILYGQ